jgi:Restriction endonuclease XhoI
MILNHVTDDSDDRLTLAALSIFWSRREQQTTVLKDGVAAGGGARAAGHMIGIRDLVSEIFIEAGLPDSTIAHEPYLPGYYRARKRWDMAVHHKGALVAALEFKSQVGSVGKNISNRFEEALGTSTDIWAAQVKNATFGEVSPWLGYVFILREDKETERAGRDVDAIFPVDPKFIGLSYSQRYQEMLARFIGDNIYQAGWFMTTRQHEDGTITHQEPLKVATARSFRTAIIGRVNYVRSILD